jgi:hypothetical protein
VQGLFIHHADANDSANRQLQEILGSHMDYKKNKEKATQEAPRKLIFFRGVKLIFEPDVLADCISDGVSEGQFGQVLETGKG